MFKFLKEKIENWVKKVARHEEPEKKARPEIIKTKAAAEPEEEKRESFFEKIKSKIQKIKISEEEFEVYKDELEMLLIENNVALEVAEKIINELREKVIGKEFLKKEIEAEIRQNLAEIIRNIRVERCNLVGKIKEKAADQSKDGPRAGGSRARAEIVGPDRVVGPGDLAVNGISCVL